jgi:hypothetical protein
VLTKEGRVCPGWARPTYFKFTRFLITKFPVSEVLNGEFLSTWTANVSTLFDGNFVFGVEYDMWARTSAIYPAKTCPPPTLLVSIVGRSKLVEMMAIFMPNQKLFDGLKSSNPRSFRRFFSFFTLFWAIPYEFGPLLEQKRWRKARYKSVHMANLSEFPEF